MKLLSSILFISLSVCGCMNNKKVQTDDAFVNNVDSITFNNSNNATTINDTIISDTVVRVLLSDALINTRKEPILSFNKYKNAHEQKWAKLLQALDTSTGINVYFKYAKPINGYTVTCRFMPFDRKSETGHIIMKFQNKTSEFLYKDNGIYANFYTNYIVFNEKDTMEWRNGDIYILDYIPPTFNDSYKKYNNNSPLGYYSPFQFLDIDFDGNQELLVSDYYMGQQGNNYMVYKIINNTLKPIHDHIPFSMLDNMTKIDAHKKQIVTYYHDGAYYSTYFFFTKNLECDCCITEFPILHSDYAEDVMKKYTAYQNHFSIDSIREIVGDTIFEYRRKGTILKLVNPIIEMNKNR